MSKILSIGTAVPPFRHKQKDILEFMLDAYRPEADDRRRISLLYERSGIDYRHSVLPDFTPALNQRILFSRASDPLHVPDIDERMAIYNREATKLATDAIRDCLREHGDAADLTCLITVSCTGMSAPGLDINIMEVLDLRPDIQRSSVNFMGCYAALHALKMADQICRADRGARVMIVCTELCTIHFQNDCEMDSIASGLLFGDGAAAVLVASDDIDTPGVRLKNFYSQVALHGRQDMTWQLSAKGFLMRLSAYIPQLLQAGITPLLRNALEAGGHDRRGITHWAIHPGGRKILETIVSELNLQPTDMQASVNVLREYGNMSSPTILFVLKEMFATFRGGEKIFAAAFGPGLTMETLILEHEPL